MQVHKTSDDTIRSDSVCKERRHTDDSPLDKQKQKKEQVKWLLLYTVTRPLSFPVNFVIRLFFFPYPVLFVVLFCFVFFSVFFLFNDLTRFQTNFSWLFSFSYWNVFRFCKFCLLLELAGRNGVCCPALLNEGSSCSQWYLSMMVERRHLNTPSPFSTTTHFAVMCWQHVALLFGQTAAAGAGAVKRKTNGKSNKNLLDFIAADWQTSSEGNLYMGGAPNIPHATKVRVRVCVPSLSTSLSIGRPSRDGDTHTRRRALVFSRLHDDVDIKSNARVTSSHREKRNKKKKKRSSSALWT